MTGGKPPKRRRGLPQEDQALWDIVASSVEPARGKERVLDVETPDTMPPMASHQTGPAKPGKRNQRPPAPTAAHAAVKTDDPKSKPLPPQPQPVVLERRRARRLARGADEIEARLDLHGMTQDDAHGALMGFIRRCHAAGLRTVLVITGKGGTGSGRDRGGDDDDHHWQRPRGVLKRNVPNWLSQPGLAPLVVSYSTAHVRHGGEGAIYVQIRVKR